MPTEIEVKFIIPDEATFTALQGLATVGPFQVEPVGIKKNIDRYLDTAARTLFKAGYVCRVRHSGDEQRLALKSLTAAAAGIHRRAEFEAVISGDDDDPATWPDSPAKELLMKLADDTRVESLFVVHQVRHKYHLTLNDSPVLELSLDAVTLVDDVTFYELESELLPAGTETDLHQFSAALQLEWPNLTLENRTKFERAWAVQQSTTIGGTMFNLTEIEIATLERLAQGDDPALAKRATIILQRNEGIDQDVVAANIEMSSSTVRRWEKRFGEQRMDIFPAETLSPSPEPDPEPIQPEPGPELDDEEEDIGREIIGLQPTDSMAEAGRKVLAYHFSVMLSSEPGTRQGEDPEMLHDMRVATRRMRATFQVFGDGFYPDAIKYYQKRLKQIGGALGWVRDLDVMIEDLEAYQAKLPEKKQKRLAPLLEHYDLLRKEARTKMLKFLDSRKYNKFKKRYYKFLNTSGLGARPIPTDEPHPYQLRHVAPVLIYSRYENVMAFETVLDNASVETLHQLRINFKRLRYALEAFRELMGDEGEYVITLAKVLQNHLGDLNDAEVASVFLQDFINNWENYRDVLDMDDKEKPPKAIKKYLNHCLQTRHDLLADFHDVWDTFNSPAMRRNLALAVANL